MKSSVPPYPRGGISMNGGPINPILIGVIISTLMFTLVSTPVSRSTTSLQLERPRICFRGVGFVARPGFERFERVGVVDMQDRVELLRQTRAKIVADALGVRPVDHANRPLEPRPRQ